MNKELTEMIYEDIDSIAQSYINQGMSEQDSYELSYKICETGLKPEYEAKRPEKITVIASYVPYWQSWRIN